MWPLYMLLVTMVVIIIERIVTIIGVSRKQQPVSKERLERPLFDSRPDSDDSSCHGLPGVPSQV